MRFTQSWDLIKFKIKFIFDPGFVLFFVLLSVSTFEWHAKSCANLDLNKANFTVNEDVHKRNIQGNGKIKINEKQTHPPFIWIIVSRGSAKQENKVIFSA